MNTMVGHVDRVTRTEVRGWAADRAAPGAALTINVLVNGRAVGRTEANLPHNGLVSLFDGSTGLYGFCFEFPWPLSVFSAHSVEVRVAGGWKVPRGQVELKQILTPRAAPVHAPAPDDVMPLSIVSTGRSGSSLAMARLARHPQITVGGDHPHEVNLLTYYAVALQTLVAPADRRRSSTPETLLAAQHRYQVGFNPFNDDVFGQHPLLADYWNAELPVDMADSFRAAIQKYYLRVGQLSDKPRAVYFAEKSQPNALVRHAALAMFGRFRQIVLFRDPRDLVCSYRSFFRADPHRAVQSIKAQLQYMLALRDSASPEVLAIKYEDMVLHAEATAQRICEFAGLEYASPVDAAQEQSVFGRHGTSGSPQASIGRWKTDLGADEIRLCEQSLAETISACGYAL